VLRSRQIAAVQQRGQDGQGVRFVVGGLATHSQSLCRTPSRSTQFCHSDTSPPGAIAGKSLLHSSFGVI
jgi:hypothetical protein